MFFYEAFPTLATPSLERALGFYRDLLGGRITYQFPAEGDPVFVTIAIGQSPLGLGEDPSVAEGASGRFELCVYTDDCDAAVQRLRAAGCPVVEGPADQPWGERMARVEDPDGNRLVLLTATEGPQAGA